MKTKHLKKFTHVLSIFMMVFMLFSCSNEPTDADVILSQEELEEKFISKLSADKDFEDYSITSVTLWKNADSKKAQENINKELEIFRDEVIMKKYSGLKALDFNTQSKILYYAFEAIVQKRSDKESIFAAVNTYIGDPNAKNVSQRGGCPAWYYNTGWLNDKPSGTPCGTKWWKCDCNYTCKNYWLYYSQIRCFSSNCINKPVFYCN